jgi:RNA polymerase sigma factor (sigma-70 family)
MSSEKPAANAAEELVPLVYDQLREVARWYFRNLRPGFTLRPTEVVNEACLHLMQHARVEWQSPEHFRAIATRKIWQVVVDHLRRRQAAKRGGRPQTAPAQTAQSDDGWQRVPLEAIAIEWHHGQVELLDLAEALEDLAAEDRRLAEVVKLHWFGGLKYTDVASVLGVSSSTCEKDFRYALAWLNRRLSGEQRNGT